MREGPSSIFDEFAGGRSRNVFCKTCLETRSHLCYSIHTTAQCGGGHAVCRACGLVSKALQLPEPQPDRAESVPSASINFYFNPLPAPGIVVGAVHGRRGTRAAARGAPGAAW